MSAESDLYTALSGANAVTNLVSNRIYPDFIPAKASGAYIVYQRADTEVYTTIHSSAICAQSVTLLIQMYASARDDVDTLTEAVLAALAGASFVVANRGGAYVEDVDRHVVEISVIHNS